MKRKLRLLIPLVAMVVLAAGCYYDNKEDLLINNPGHPDACDTSVAITYTGQVKNILDTKCAVSNCHNSGSLAGGVDLSMYSTAFNFRERIRQRALITGDMPQVGSPALSDCEKLMLTKWLDSGAAQ